MKTTDIETIITEEKHDFSSLVKIMEILRSEQGCPWDREQTHRSIRADIIEETYEVIEAIDTDDPVLLREELGDVLLQVVFHARISEEDGQFTVQDVIHDICAKLIHRHPHIFADVEAETTEEVLTNWEKIKTEEKQRIGLYGSLDSIPPSLPSLMRAQKCVKKTCKAGIVPADEDLADRLTAMAAAVAAGGTAEEMRGKIADLLFITSSIAQKNGIDCEEILGRKITDFTGAIGEMERTGDLTNAVSPEMAKKCVNTAFFKG